MLNVTLLLLGKQTLMHQVRVTGSFFTILVTSVGIFGNVLLLSALATSRKLRQRSNIFIGTLSLMELILCVLIYPFYINTYMKGEWVFNNKICAITSKLQQGLSTSCIFHVIAITLYRYFLIAHSNIYKYLTTTVAIIICLLVMILFPLVSTLGVEFRYLLKEGQHHVYSVYVMQCLHTDDAGESGSSITFVVGIFVTAFVIMAFCYIRIFIIVRQSRKRIEAGTGKATTEPTALNMRKEIRLMQTMAVIFVVFLCIYIPYPVVLRLFYTMYISQSIHMTVNVLFWCSSAVNWVIYGMMHPDFRRAYKNLWLKLRNRGKLNMNITQTEQTEDTKIGRENKG